MGQKMTVDVPPLVLSALGQKGGHWLPPGRMLKHQVVLLDQDDVELQTPLPCSQPRSWHLYQKEASQHDCVHQLHCSRGDPLGEDPDWELSASGSNFVSKGEQKFGCAVGPNPSHPITSYHLCTQG